MVVAAITLTWIGIEFGWLGGGGGLRAAAVHIRHCRPWRFPPSDFPCAACSVSVLLDHLDLSSCGLTGEGASMVLRAGAVELRLFDNALEDKVAIAKRILVDLQFEFFFSKILT